jgi:hypothetical protein
MPKPSKTCGICIWNQTAVGPAQNLQGHPHRIWGLEDEARDNLGQCLRRASCVLAMGHSGNLSPAR